jgi:FMN-dependent NADH-azoreductase
MKILFINACVRKESRTLVLANELLSGLPGEIEELKLVELNLKPLDEQRINSRLINEDEQVYAKQFAAADIIVIAAPMWDLSFPALLKLYVENITIKGITFKYTETGIVGLCKAKKLYYISTSGGSFVPDFGYEYIKALSNVMFGISNVEIFKAEGLDIWGNNVEEILDSAIIKIEDHLLNVKE